MLASSRSESRLRIGHVLQDTEGIPRDVHTYVSLINGCAVSRSLQQAQTLVSH